MAGFKVITSLTRRRRWAVSFYHHHHHHFCQKHLASITGGIDSEGPLRHSRDISITGIKLGPRSIHFVIVKAIARARSGQVIARGHLLHQDSLLQGVAGGESRWLQAAAFPCPSSAACTEGQNRQQLHASGRGLVGVR